MTDQPYLTVDVETKSHADLRKVGASVYAQHPTTKIICLSWGYGEFPIQTWLPGDEPPLTLLGLVENGVPVEAHNVAFEYSIWKYILEPQFGWKMPKLTQWRDTMATACYYALPAGLDNLLRALGLGGKNPIGTRLISRYCKLHLKTAQERIPNGSEEDWISWSKMFDWEKALFPWAEVGLPDGRYDRPGMYRDHLQLFVDYCEDDVLKEQRVSDYLGLLPDAELENFHLDLEVNARGLFLDTKGIADAMAIVQEQKDITEAEFQKLTGLKTTQRDQIMKWCLKQGIRLENLQAEYIETLLEMPDDEAMSDDTEGWESIGVNAIVREALTLRALVSKSSTSKLEAMVRNRGKNGRAAFQTRFHGAQTGRNTGAGFQPLNLVRSYEDVEPEQLVRDISFRDLDWLTAIYGDPMEAVSKALRHYIIAEDGYRLMSGDFVSVEAMILAVIAKEEWKVKAFHDREPIYELMGCKIHKLGAAAEALAHKDKKAFKAKYPDERTDGKTGELMGGYQGNLGAWRKFDSTDRHTDHEVRDIVGAWRAENSNIALFWPKMQWASLDAVRRPGTRYEVNEFIAFQMFDEWLAMILPNGKRIWYYDAQIRLRWPAWHKPKEFEDCADGSCGHEKIQTLTYMSQKFGHWRRVSTYGGKETENAVQAISRELLVPRVKRLNAYGYPVILTVYDEVVAEVPNGFGSTEEFHEMLNEGDDWNRDWPIRCDTPWEGPRYRK